MQLFAGSIMFIYTSFQLPGMDHRINEANVRTHILLEINDDLTLLAITRIKTQKIPVIMNSM